MSSELLGPKPRAPTRTFYRFQRLWYTLAESEADRVIMKVLWDKIEGKTDSKGNWGKEEEESNEDCASD
jgi:hypothetical protein